MTNDAVGKSVTLLGSLIACAAIASVVSGCSSQLAREVPDAEPMSTETGQGGNSGQGGNFGYGGSEGPFFRADASTLMGLDDGCGGITARQVLAQLQPSYTTTFQPEPSGAPVGLNIAVSYSDSGALVCMPQYCRCGSAVFCPQSSCPPPSIAIPATVVFRTDDGTFDETLSTTLSYPSADPTQVDWTAIVAGSDIRGSYVFTLGTRAQEKMAFSGRFDHAAAKGAVGELDDQKSGGGGTWGY